MSSISEAVGSWVSRRGGSSSGSNDILGGTQTPTGNTGNDILGNVSSLPAGASTTGESTSAGSNPWDIDPLRTEQRTGSLFGRDYTVEQNYWHNDMTRSPAYYRGEGDKYAEKAAGVPADYTGRFGVDYYNDRSQTAYLNADKAAGLVDANGNPVNPANPIEHTGVPDFSTLPPVGEDILPPAAAENDPFIMPTLGTAEGMEDPTDPAAWMDQYFNDPSTAVMREAMEGKAEQKMHSRGLQNSALAAQAGALAAADATAPMADAQAKYYKTLQQMEFNGTLAYGQQYLASASDRQKALSSEIAAIYQNDKMKPEAQEAAVSKARANAKADLDMLADFYSKSPVWESSWWAGRSSTPDDMGYHKTNWQLDNADRRGVWETEQANYEKDMAYYQQEMQVWEQSAPQMGDYGPAQGGYAAYQQAMQAYQTLYPQPTAPQQPEAFTPANQDRSGYESALRQWEDANPKNQGSGYLGDFMHTYNGLRGEEARSAWAADKPDPADYGL